VIWFLSKFCCDEAVADHSLSSVVGWTECGSIELVYSNTLTNGCILSGKYHPRSVPGTAAAIGTSAMSLM